MATLNVTNLKRSGVTVTAQSVNDAGDKIPVTGKEVIVIKNNGVGSHTVTFKAQKKSQRGILTDVAVTVAAGGKVWCGPFPKSHFDNGAGLMEVNYTSGASSDVTLEIVRLQDDNPLSETE